MNLNKSTWQNISYEYKNLNTTLQHLALHVKEKRSLEYSLYIKEYDSLTKEIDSLFKSVENAWKTSEKIELVEPLHVEYEELYKELTNLEKASLSNWIQNLQDLHNTLRELSDTLNYLNSYKESIKKKTPPSSAQFVFLDREYLKGFVQSFLIYTFSVIIWIYFNPPGGFVFVTLATLLSVLTSFSPLKPSLLAIVFTVGFIFAIIMYIGVLPYVIYPWEAAIFIFMYAFIAFYWINPKLSIFFLLGHATLGLSNTMSFNFDIFLMILLMFYMFLAVLMLFYYILFSTKPEHLFITMKRRYFKHLEALLARPKFTHNYHKHHLQSSVGKLQLWGSKIDSSYFSKNSAENIKVFTQECALLANKVIYLREVKENELIKNFHEEHSLHQMEKLANSLQKEHLHTKEIETIHELENRVEELLEEFKLKLDIEQYSKETLAQTLNYIALSHSTVISLHHCVAKAEQIEWNDLRVNRF